ncbi:Alpha-ketoglutarate-dependent sulfate ester dioxygenase [Rhodovastum atsumiense]|uniref:TauD/TfdA family dioxygenase n=1 Tax=Rhodovastum atsumiense TaxID=504468 RepID=A0A5M6IWB9_9PROT|nr:TauD/TfdA family dioxygenase [Rhodovastum atsumiense]KAA5612614.1 TauD/TfdA family dioxygenase [Rhodovastum atsumiense]CAH2601286.1 Alpha-ketoglutarate-dependent sulfate ester dioxygenase [Rhodovastum atsumiense]
MPTDNHNNTTPSEPVIRPVGGHIGAEIEGITLSGQLTAKAVALVRQALLRHKVLFVRGQHHLDDVAQQEFGRLLGDLVEHPTQPSRTGTAILELDASRGGGRADRWHTDVTFVDAYPAITILRAVTVPAFGGDTVWANTAAAYDGLSPALRALADQLWAVHSNEYDYAAQRPHATEADHQTYRQVFTSTVYETEHPVVHVHPETGERSLILGSFIRRFLGHSQDQSELLYRLLQGHATRPDYTTRWRWREGDVVLWDNRATQHIAINDYGDQPRVVRRITIAGVAPVAIDGRRSVTRRPAPLAAAAE